MAAKTSDRNVRAVARATERGAAGFSRADGFRATPAGQFHLTVRFLGEVPDERVPALSDALRSACAASPRFALAPARLLFLPDERRARVVALGVASPPPELFALRETVDAVAERFGVEREGRPFLPHFTVGRFKAHPPAADSLAKFRRAFEEAAAPELSPHPTDTLELVMSTLKPAGPVHDTVAAFPLS